MKCACCEAVQPGEPGKDILPLVSLIEVQKIAPDLSEVALVFLKGINV